MNAYLSDIEALVAYYTPRIEAKTGIALGDIVVMGGHYPYQNFHFVMANGVIVANFVYECPSDMLDFGVVHELSHRLAELINPFSRQHYFFSDFQQQHPGGRYPEYLRISIQKGNARLSITEGFAWYMSLDYLLEIYAPEVREKVVNFKDELKQYLVSAHNRGMHLPQNRRAYGGLIVDCTGYAFFAELAEKTAHAAAVKVIRDEDFVFDELEEPAEYIKRKNLSRGRSALMSQLTGMNWVMLDTVRIGGPLSSYDKVNVNPPLTF